MHVYPLYLLPSTFAFIPDINRWRKTGSDSEPGDGEHDDFDEEENAHGPAEADSRDEALNHDGKADCRKGFSKESTGQPSLRHTSSGRRAGGGAVAEHCISMKGTGAYARSIDIVAT